MDDEATNEEQDERPAGVPFLRHLLGGRLRRIRDNHGLSRKQLGDALGLSSAIIQRLETGRNIIKVHDVNSWVAQFGLDPATTTSLRAMAKESKEHGWWAEEDVHPQFGALVEAERLARRIQNWEPNILPGLLQTAEYTKAVISGERFLLKDDVPLPLDKALARAERRKLVLFAEDSPEGWFIIGESALRMRVGNADLMRAQVQHLIEVCENKNVRIQVLTENSGYHVGAAGSFAVYLFSDLPGDGVAYTELDMAFKDQPAKLARHTRKFQLLTSQALDPQASRSYLQATLTDKESWGN
ncbi:helix-turn-helix transcriptional regulator [Kitasatospora sp. NBC_01287]|uniref:helix-turn-helix domain-containing protein n=1 Tax=Kitasatospora sp. NBC_01287 TaxID=2903573 RepID=UPI00224DD9FE|nr:helix-turn-helix transcriptional regulator [Kitasatospora sp. NBC_01287]MCX4745981.1 helix-turn-helix transcriptional regulator [Kitasatospora sp. NBC_01287]